MKDIRTLKVSGVFHVPVMLREVLEVLVWREEGVYVDGTVGGGGHAEGILRRTRGRLVGIDRDPEAVAEAGRRLAAFGDRVTLICARFSEMGEILQELGIYEVDGILLDLGVSWHQIEDPDRGFSYRQDGPLDMRMSPDGPTAEEVVNRYPEEALVRLFREYGGERFAKRIARGICRARGAGPISSTGQLRDIVLSVVPNSIPHKMLSRVFQAIRIEVNDELRELERGLEVGFSVLVRGGRLVALSYHSSEDRIVKEAFRRWKEEGKVRLLGRFFPSQGEVAENPRARGAKLRAVEKLLGGRDVSKGISGSDVGGWNRGARLRRAALGAGGGPVADTGGGALRAG